MLAPAVRGGEVEQWDEIKAAVSEAVIDGGGTITHHHAVGRDHRPWYDRQRPDPFAAALRGGEGGGRSGRDPEPRRADRLTAALRCRDRLIPPAGAIAPLAGPPMETITEEHPTVEPAAGSSPPPQAASLPACAGRPRAPC